MPRSLKSERQSSSDLECAGRAKRRRRFGLFRMTPQRITWPHAPTHRLSTQGTYIVTAGTYQKAHHFRGRDRVAVLHRGLLSVANRFNWQLEAWSVFSNHYHFVGHSPDTGADNLAQMLSLLHEKTAKWINKVDRSAGREVWHNFWETRLTHKNSYLARLNYVHQNAVKQGLVYLASQYPWWFGGLVRNNSTTRTGEDNLRFQNRQIKST